MCLLFHVIVPFFCGQQRTVITLRVYLGVLIILFVGEVGESIPLEELVSDPKRVYWPRLLLGRQLLVVLVHVSSAGKSIRQVIFLPLDLV